jgi:predicted ester cyclase
VSLEENKVLVRRTIEVINTQDLSSIENIVAPDFVDHTRQVRGLENLRQFLSMIFKGFSDWHINIEDIIAEGEKVWIRITVTGTHTGDWMGIAPTGKKFTEHQVWIYRIVDGKVVEGWDVDDDLDFYKQLGIIEYTEKGKKLFPEDE